MQSRRARYGSGALHRIKADEAYVIGTEGQPLRDRLAHYKCPRELIVVGDLPRNAMGKVLKPLLAQQFGTNAQTSSGSA